MADRTAPSRGVLNARDYLAGGAAPPARSYSDSALNDFGAAEGLLNTAPERLAPLQGSEAPQDAFGRALLALAVGTNPQFGMQLHEERLRAEAANREIDRFNIESERAQRLARVDLLTRRSALRLDIAKLAIDTETSGLNKLNTFKGVDPKDLSPAMMEGLAKSVSMPLPMVTEWLQEGFEHAQLTKTKEQATTDIEQANADMAKIGLERYAERYGYEIDKLRAEISSLNADAEQRRADATGRLRPETALEARDRGVAASAPIRAGVIEKIAGLKPEERTPERVREIAAAGAAELSQAWGSVSDIIARTDEPTAATLTNSMQTEMANYWEEVRTATGIDVTPRAEGPGPSLPASREARSGMFTHLLSRARKEEDLSDHDISALMTLASETGATRYVAKPIPIWPGLLPLPQRKTAEEVLRKRLGKTAFNRLMARVVAGPTSSFSNINALFNAPSDTTTNPFDFLKSAVILEKE